MLLYPWHCRGAFSFDLKYVYGPNYSKIGYFVPDTCENSNPDDCMGGDHNGTATRDIAVIMLYQGNWPAYLNRVIAGDPANGQYWTITADPSSSYGCGNLNGGTYWNNFAAQAFQQSSGTTLLPRVGQMLSMYSYDGGDYPNSCSVQTSLSWHGNGTGNSTDYRDSGTPWQWTALQTTSLNFESSGCSAGGASCQNGGSNPRLLATPLYDGIQVMKNAVGGHLCHNASCT